MAMAQPLQTRRTRMIGRGATWLGLLIWANAAPAHAPAQTATHQTATHQSATHPVSHAGAPRPAAAPGAARAPAPTTARAPAQDQPAIAAHMAPPHRSDPVSHRASPPNAAYGMAPTGPYGGGVARSADHHAAAPGYATVGRNAGWSTSWRSDPRYNWTAWRTAHRDTFHPGYYYPPYGGYDYAPLAVGALLAAEFWREQYWIDDPQDYHLPPPWGPYRWVRYYNDCLLVDIDSGEVVDVAYNVFW